MIVIECSEDSKKYEIFWIERKCYFSRTSRTSSSAKQNSQKIEVYCPPCQTQTFVVASEGALLP